MLNVEILRQMLSQDRINDLIELMEGESKYTSDSMDNMPKTEDEKMARGDALDHVRFVSKFGEDKERVIEGDMVYSSRDEEFNAWLEMGAPGIVPSELEAYLEENPLS